MSTDIDALLGDDDDRGRVGDDLPRTARAQTHTSPTVDEPAATPEEPSAQRRRGLRESFQILLPLAIAGTLIAGLFLFDEVGPTSARRATITDTYTSKSGKRNQNTDYNASGYDERGGTFELDLPRDSWLRVEIGEQVTIHRARLTGRVVEVDDTSGWSMRSESWRFGVLLGATLLAGLVVLGCIVALARLRMPLSPRRRRGERLWFVGVLAATMVALVVFVNVKRDEANASGGTTVELPPDVTSRDDFPASPTTVPGVATASSEPAAATTTGPCSDAETRARQALHRLTIDGELTLIDAMGVRAGEDFDCLRAIDRVLCTASGWPDVDVDRSLGC